MIKKMFLCAVFCVILVACQLPFSYVSQQPTPVPYSEQPEASIYTPTPFQPAQTVSDPASGGHPDTSSSPDSGSQSKSNDLSVPTPTATTIPQRRFNILLLGSDWRPAAGFRTDVMLLISINQDSGQVSMISFPRDLYVYIPGYGEDRINTAQARGGFETTIEVFQQNFGIKLDRYVITNFSGFTNLVDTFGGIEINAEKELYDRCDLPQAVDGYCYVPVGYHWMDGQTALWYARSRYSSSDFDRTRRAQEIMLGLFNQLVSFDALIKAPEIYSIIVNNIETNLTIEEILALLPYGSNVLNNPSALHRFAISSSEVTGYTVPETGAMVLLPNYDEIQVVLNDAFSY